MKFGKCNLTEVIYNARLALSTTSAKWKCMAQIESNNIYKIILTNIFQIEYSFTLQTTQIFAE